MTAPVRPPRQPRRARRRTGSLDVLQHERPIPLRFPAADTQRVIDAAESLNLSGSAYARLLFRLGEQLHRRTGVLQLPEHVMDRLAADVLAWAVQSAQAARV